MLEWLIKLERVKYDGWKRQAFWLRMLIRAYCDRTVNPSKEYYCLATGAVLNLARQHGFALKISPKKYRAIRATQEFEDINNAGKRSLLRHYDWFLFERQ